MTLQEKADKYLAQGCTTYSKRADQFIKGVYPTHALAGNGAKLLCENVKGTFDYYIDYLCGLGSNLIDIQNNYSLPCEEEVELAERLVNLFPCIDKLRFLKTGSEACQAAVRIARAYNEMDASNPTPVYGIGNGYHGWHNQFIASEKPGTGCVYESYEKFSSLEDVIKEFKLLIGTTFEIRWLCYVIIEPIMLDMNNNTITQLRKLRKLCTKHDIVLIFDEVITGFRTPKYCMANYLDIQPDIIVLGKALGNGFPISVVGGKAKFMDTPDYFISSTFAGEQNSLEKALDTLDYLSPVKLERLWCNGAWFQQEFNKLTPGLKLKGIPTRAVWEGDKEFKDLFWQECIKRGVLFGKAWFITFAHTRKVLKDTLKVCREAMKSINNGATLEGEPSKEIFKRT